MNNKEQTIKQILKDSIEEDDKTIMLSIKKFDEAFEIFNETLCYFNNKEICKELEELLDDMDSWSIFTRHAMVGSKGYKRNYYIDDKDVHKEHERRRKWQNKVMKKKID